MFRLRLKHLRNDGSYKIISFEFWCSYDNAKTEKRKKERRRRRSMKRVKGNQQKENTAMRSQWKDGNSAKMDLNERLKSNMQMYNRYGAFVNKIVLMYCCCCLCFPITFMCCERQPDRFWIFSGYLHVTTLCWISWILKIMTLRLKLRLELNGSYNIGIQA